MTTFPVESLYKIVDQSLPIANSEVGAVTYGICKLIRQIRSSVQTASEMIQLSLIHNNGLWSIMNERQRESFIGLDIAGLKIGSSKWGHLKQIIEKGAPLAICLPRLIPQINALGSIAKEDVKSGLDVTFTVNPEMATIIDDFQRAGMILTKLEHFESYHR